MLRKSLWLPNQKPLGPVELDWDNWLVRKLKPVGVYVYQDGTMLNLVTGIPAIAMNAPTTVIDRDGGRAIYSGTYPDGSAIAPFWDTGIKADSSMRFVAVWQRYLDTPSINNYYNGIHDGTNRFYVNGTSASATQPLFSWGNTAYTPTQTRTAPAINQREMVAMSVSASGNIQGYINGAAYGAASGVATFSVPSTRSFYIGKRTYNVASGTTTGQGTANSTDLVIIGRGILTHAEVAELYRNPYQILKPRTRRAWVPVVSTGGIQGDLAATESGADTFSSTGAVHVSGILSAGESGADTFSSTGTVHVSGILSAGESGADTFSSTGTVHVSGILSAGEAGADTFSSTGAVHVSGILSAGEAGADTFSSTGAVHVSGILSAGEAGSDAFSSTGTVGGSDVIGSFSAIESGSDSIIISGRVFIQGLMSSSESGSDIFTSVTTAPSLLPVDRYIAAFKSSQYSSPAIRGSHGDDYLYLGWRLSRRK